MAARQLGRTPLVAAAFSLLLQPNAAAGTLDTRNGKERPVMKVVRLLQDMKVELQKELEDDKKVHEMLGCWCDSNRREKTKAAELGEARSTQLQSDMDAAAAKTAELREKRTTILAEVDTNHAALAQARDLRMRESKEFRTEEADLIEAVTACKQAVSALSKHNPELPQLRAIAQRLQEPRISQLLPTDFLGGSQKDALQKFLARAAAVGPDASFLAVPGYQSYAPQSGQIFGILKTMQEEFEGHLKELQAAEKKAQEEHEQLRAAKEDEISAGRKAIVGLDTDLADLGATHARAAEELEDTEGQLKLDRKFLANLEPKCKESAAEYDRRVQSRLDEIAAVEDTVGILNSDEAFDAFDKSVNTAFLQTSAVSDKAARDQHLRERAAAVLARLRSSDGGVLASASLAALQTSVQLDAFERVKAEIDKLLSELARQQKDEVDQRDWCKDELAKNERATTAADEKKANLDTKIADESKTVEQLSADIASAQGTIAEMQEQMKRASEAREAENAEFQQTVSDQRLTQTILKKALARMRQVYAFVQRQQQQKEDEQPGAPHIATSATHTDPGNGPARFTKYEQNAAGGRVLKLLETVLSDSTTTETEAIASEEDAQAAYETLMKDSNAGIARYSESINDLSGSRAKAKAALSMAETDLKQTVEELHGLSEMRGDLGQSCNFVLKNFETRQAARAAEMDAIKEAKAILSGMK
eukprot:TRINITY_DN45676_c0_g1_i1.p1 TRINITY_DN45676_c0_g1~~TRINITY_DN45676_c0_g1_i1.p1  ORF type:complete len:706 (-),score=240.96 TRINITY_DN45676_c0_g1_i1:62-2179(-)